jgi:drug/metabolite transporter (DMT)-like permease
MVKLFPIIFIVLWSSAFVTTKPIINNSDPFSALAFRFLFVAIGFFLFSLYEKKKILIKKKFLVNSLGTGVLFHGFYLGGVFYAVFVGLPVNVAALIVTLQPVLTNALAGKFLNEKVQLQQWLGVMLGFVGAILVIGLDIGEDLPINGIVAVIISLIAITASTIWQKKVSNDVPLSVNNMYQAIGAVIFHLLIIVLFFNDPFLNLTSEFLFAMSHQIILVSFGAFSILMFLIKSNTASKTVSLFFLIPCVTALMSWYFLDEILTKLDNLGFFIASIGVYMSNYKKN